MSKRDDEKDEPDLEPRSEDRPLSLVPLRPGDAPFRSLLALKENEPGYLAEAKREIRSLALRRLETLERVYLDLVYQAEEIVDRAKRDLSLHDFPVNAIKIRGQTYHLYERPDHVPPRFFSILCPEEYAAADSRARYLATYRLNEDSSWTWLDGSAEETWLVLDGAPER
jgi:hypothetical protein